MQCTCVFVCVSVCVCVCCTIYEGKGRLKSWTLGAGVAFPPSSCPPLGVAVRRKDWRPGVRYLPPPPAHGPGPGPLSAPWTPIPRATSARPSPHRRQVGGGGGRARTQLPSRTVCGVAHPPPQALAEGVPRGAGNSNAAPPCAPAQLACGGSSHKDCMGRRYPTLLDATCCAGRGRSRGGGGGVIAGGRLWCVTGLPHNARACIRRRLSRWCRWAAVGRGWGQVGGGERFPCPCAPSLSLAAQRGGEAAPATRSMHAKSRKKRRTGGGASLPPPLGERGGGGGHHRRRRGGHSCPPPALATPSHRGSPPLGVPPPPYRGACWIQRGECAPPPRAGCAALCRAELAGWVCGYPATGVCLSHCGQRNARALG